TTTATPPNLLINPDAEVSALTRWTQTGSSNVLQDTGSTLYGSYNPYAGNACFAGDYGSGGSPSSLLQNVNLTNEPQNFSTVQLGSGTSQIIIDQSDLVGRVLIPVSHGDRIRSVHFW
ncbi:unnamed protein product, partial [Rotaria magnacalcarata]